MQRFPMLLLLGVVPVLGCDHVLPRTQTMYVIEAPAEASLSPTTTSSSSQQANASLPSTDAAEVDAAVDPEEQQRISRYVVGAGDRLEILYTESWNAQGEYRLLPGDRVRIEYLHLFRMDEDAEVPDPVAASGLDRDLLVSPDGKITLPYVGVVDAAGNTVTELADRLNAKYQEYYLEPKMLVTLLETGSRLEDLRQAIRTAGSRLVRVAPDGTITLPHVGIVPAADLTLAELQTELAERYRRTALGFAVTVRLAAPDARGAGASARSAPQPSGASSPTTAAPARSSR